MKEKVCKNCKWSYLIKGYLQVTGINYYDHYFCRYDPPTYVLDYGSCNKSNCIHPAVNEDNFCSKFEEKEGR